MKIFVTHAGHRFTTTEMTVAGEKHERDVSLFKSIGPDALDRISDNALAVAQHLKKHPKVKWVNYAGLPDHPDHALVKKYLRDGKASGLLTFGVDGGREGGARFLDALQLFTRLVNIGDVRSLATHPASTTHRQLNPEELAKSGVTEDTVRLCVGIEHIDDLRADLDQSLAAV